MAYIAGIIIAGLFFLALHYFTELTNKQKFLVTAVILSIILSAIAFNSYSNAQSQKMLDVVARFNRQSTVECNGTDVNSTNFTLSIGTYTFIGKEHTPNFGQMISASKCK